MLVSAGTRAIALSLGLLGTGACAEALPLASQLTQGPQTTVSPAGVDGTRYLAVETGRLTGARAVASRWRRTAHQVCDGDYQTLSDAGSTVRRGGVIRSRIHEGYIRCILPAGDEPDANGPSVADAKPTTPQPARARRRPRAVARNAGR